MKAKDFRKSAYGKIKKKCWGTLAAAELIMSIILGACAGLNRFYIGWIGSLLLGGALTLGASFMALSVTDGKSIKVDNIFGGFKQFGSSLVLNILISIFTFLWSLLLIVPGIIMSLAYSMSYFVLLDNPELSPDAARKKSIELMKGYKWKLFCLKFSFIGWYLLSILTLGILFFWVNPYERAAEAEFYRNIVGQKEAQNNTTEENNTVVEETAPVEEITAVEETTPVEEAAPVEETKVVDTEVTEQ